MQKEKRKTFTFRVPESVHLQMELAANKESRTVNSWLLNIVKQYLDEQNAKKQGAGIMPAPFNLILFNHSVVCDKPENFAGYNIG